MPICRNPEVVRPLLLADEPGTRSIYNIIFGVTGARAAWIRVDDLDHPQAVVCRGAVRGRGMMLYLWATGPRAAEQVMREIPRHWKFEFAATPTRFLPVARRLRKIRWVGTPCYMYVLDPRKLMLNRAHRVGTLRDEDVPVVTRYWTHGKSQEYIRWRIQVGPTCAVRDRGKLAAWALTHADGTMGILHVLKEYRGQDMARSITTALARRCLKAGIKPFLYILRNNRASINLTESMGFTRYGTYVWFGE
jgi:GNAT superfamily N-acetyltransferase